MIDDKDFLYRQLDGLGQLIADGEADEPDGKWIRQQYRETAIALGIAKPSDFRKPRKNHSKQINDFMAERVKVVKCRKCGGELVQSRRGSFVADCKSCGARYKLGRRGRK
jgi:ribosomal protein S27E